MWELKEKGKNFKVKWEILCRAIEYSKKTGRCALCTEEKVRIMDQTRRTMLNSREKIFNRCFHRTKHKVGEYRGEETEPGHRKEIGEGRRERNREQRNEGGQQRSQQ